MAFSRLSDTYKRRPAGGLGRKQCRCHSPAKVESSSHAPISILDFTDISWPQDNGTGVDIPIRFSIKNNGKGGAKIFAFKRNLKI